MSDCEIPQYYVCTEPVARKQHACVECSAPIKVGEKHLRVDACWENTPDRFRQHTICAEACELIRDSGINDDECVYYGGLKEYWTETRCEVWHSSDLAARGKLWRLMLRIYRRERREAVPA